MSNLSNGLLAPVTRPIDSPTVLADALRALAVGPSQTEETDGFVTKLPAGITVRRVNIDDGIATIELESTRPDEPLYVPDAALAQIVFTATQFPTVRAVTVNIDRQHAVAPHRSSSSDDPPSSGTHLSRTDFEAWSPAVLIESPATGETINTPVRIYGSANTFEAVFNIEITDRDGRTVASQTVMATSGSGTRGTFDVTIPYAVTLSGHGEIIASVESAKDGSNMVVSEVLVIVSP